MPTEWPPKQPAPKPSGPDPAAVRAAVYRIRRAIYHRSNGRMTDGDLVSNVTNYFHNVEAAARAWLARQDGEANE